MSDDDIRAETVRLLEKYAAATDITFTSIN